MRNKWKIHFKAVVWKEFKESIRTSKFSLPFTIVFIIIMQYLPVSQILNNGVLSVGQKDVMLGSLAIYIPLMAIPFFGNTLVYKSLYEEKSNKTIQILMASGVIRTAIWFAKFLVAGIFSYFVSLISILGYAAFLNFYIGRPLVLDSTLWILVLITMPATSFGILAIISVAYWWLKNAQLVGMIVPLVSLLGVWNISLNFGQAYSAPVAVLISIIMSLTLLSISFYAVTHISKERIASR